ncbi:hypothetical protein AOLI_G00149600 [Acnodon oligacanthus]
MLHHEAWEPGTQADERNKKGRAGQGSAVAMLWVCRVLGQRAAPGASHWWTCLRVTLRGDSGGQLSSGVAGPSLESLAQLLPIPLSLFSYRMVFETHPHSLGLVK